MFGFQHIACDPLTILIKILQNFVVDMVTNITISDIEIDKRSSDIDLMGHRL